MPIEHRQGRRGDDHGSAARNRRIARASGLNACLGGQGTRERSRAVAAWRLLRCALGLAAITALAACGEGDPLNFSGSGAATETVKPTVNMQLTPSTVAMGQSATLTWSASEAQSCTASGGWSGVQPTTGRWSTAPLSANTSYTLTCSGVGGTGARSIQVTVTHPAPVVTLLASPATIPSLGSSTLTWTTTNANECTASGGWHGQLATSGTWSTGSLSNTTEYELTCRGPWGSATQSATVTVSAESPTVTLQASPSSLRSGDSSTLSWSSQNATSCTASGAWSGTKGVSGSQSTGPVKENSTYTLTCTGFGRSATQSATVSVTSLAPTVSISAGPSTIASGGSSTLTWSSTNATACTASGGWSGSKGTSGTQSTGALTNSATYTLTCLGPAGSAAQSTTVSVKAPLPTVSLSVGPSAITSGGSATLDVVVHQCDRLHRLRCLVGQQSPERLTIHRCAHGQRDLYPDLYRTRRQRDAVRDGLREAPHRPSSLSASPSTITSGSSSILAWSATNATSCTASGGWSGAKATSGSQSTGALTANTTYTLTCTGAAAAPRSPRRSRSPHRPPPRQ